MPAYRVNYDLRKPGRNYQPLWDRLKAWNAVRVLESSWIVPQASSAINLRDDLSQHMDSNDGLLVTGMTGESAWRGISPSAELVLRQGIAA
jgi:hypothetical protein